MKLTIIFCLITLTLSSKITYASERVERTCVGDVTQFAPVKEYILVEKKINSSTGIIRKIKTSTTFLSFEDCKANFNIEKLDKPTLNNKEIELRSKIKCYADSSSQKLYLLVNEQRNPETGIVVKLKILNEFIGIENCISNLSILENTNLLENK